MALYLDEPDVLALASEALTDGPDDRKIDFLYLDPDGRRVIFAQGYFSSEDRSAAPSNKAADLNTAAAWLFHGEIAEVPTYLRDQVAACREGLHAGELDTIELIYVHNLPESRNVERELETAEAAISASLPDDSGVLVVARELGLGALDKL